LITDQEDLAKLWILRKLLGPMEPIEAMEFLMDRLKATKTNAEFFDTMKQG
jgi:transcription termination factor Rho